MLDHNQFATRTKRCCRSYAESHNCRIYRRTSDVQTVEKQTPTRHLISISIFSFFSPPSSRVYVILARNIASSVGAQILPDIYMHLFPGGVCSACSRLVIGSRPMSRWKLKSSCCCCCCFHPGRGKGRWRGKGTYLFPGRVAPTCGRVLLLTVSQGISGSTVTAEFLRFSALSRY